MEKEFLFISDDVGSDSELTLVWSDKVIRGKGVKGICLDKSEIEIIKLVFTHKIVSASLLTEMYMVLRAHNNKKSVSNRLARLVKSKVLFQKKHASHFNNVTFSYFYSVGELGFKLLKCLDLPDCMIEQNTYEPSRIRIPNTHNLYAIEAIHRLFIENQLLEEPLPIKIERGAASELFKLNNPFVKGTQQSDNNLVIPDYVITLNDQVICFENDMGTEKARVIQQKEAMYCRITEYEHLKNKRVHVLYSVVEEKKVGESGDNSLSRARRIASIKSAHSPSKEWSENLSFYVTTSNEFVGLAFFLLQSTYPLPSFLKQIVVSDVGKKIKLHHLQRKGLQTEEIQVADLIVDQRDTEHLPVVTAHRVFARQGTYKSIVYLSGEFASVRTYQELNTVSHLLGKSSSTLFKQEYLPIEIVVCYPRTLNLAKEYFGFTPPVTIYLINAEEWSTADNENLGSWKLVTAYKKEQEEW